MRDLKERTRAYSLRIINLYNGLPPRSATRVLREQVLRSGTSVGAHYREATRGRSTAEFIAKLNAGLMELEETAYWLELLEDGRFVPPRKLTAVTDETNQLIAIFVAVIRDAKR